jgi:hypothetical protein
MIASYMGIIDEVYYPSNRTITLKLICSDYEQINLDKSIDLKLENVNKLLEEKIASLE